MRAKLVLGLFHTGEFRFNRRLTSRAVAHLPPLDAMEVIYFTLIAIVVYLASDWILNRVEIWRGERFEYRSLIFFAIILVLALASFSLMRFLTA